MKICLVGQPRSRSNYLLDCLSSHYQVECLGEPYQTLFEQPKITKEYNDRVRELSKDIHEKHKSFSVKIQTTNMAFNATSLLDLEQFLFDSFDLIYLTYRKNIVDQICSVLLALKYDIFTWLEPPNPAAYSCVFDPTTEWYILNSTHFDMIKIKFLELYLQSQGLKYTKLEYNDIPRYVTEKLHKGRSDKSETGFDYQKIFENYALLEQVVSTYFGTTLFE